MTTKEILKIQGYFSLIGASGLLIWWFMMPVLLPVTEATNNFQNLILDNDWIIVNLVGLISILFLILGIPGFYLIAYNKLKKLGFTGLVLTIIGLILYACVQYYETLIWPAAAQLHPEMLAVDGALVSGNNNVVSGLLTSGAFLGIGYILFGIALLKSNVFAKIPVWFLILGAPVFGNGIAFPVRTLGLLLFGTGTIWLAFLIIKNRSNQT